MRYPPEHKAAARRQLLDKSGAHAKQHGFAASGVDALMQAAGLTSGAFYGHFRSKNAFFAAIIESELGKSEMLFAGLNPENREQTLKAALGFYLSLGHVRHPEAGCALPSLAAEAGRAEPATREAFEAALLKIHTTLTRALGSEAAAWVVVSQCAGAVMLARAMASPEQQRAVLDAARDSLLAQFLPPAPH